MVKSFLQSCLPPGIRDERCVVEKVRCGISKSYSSFPHFKTATVFLKKKMGTTAPPKKKGPTLYAQTSEQVSGALFVVRVVGEGRIEGGG